MVKELGLKLYNRINGEDQANRLVGELVFSEYLFDKFIDVHSINHLIKENEKYRESATDMITTPEIQQVRKVIPGFIEECAREIEKLATRIGRFFIILLPKLFFTSFSQKNQGNNGCADYFRWSEL